MPTNFPFAMTRGDGPIEGEAIALVPWWSITKAVLAAAALRLVEQGQLCLDEAYLDWPFTHRQLLRHTSGLTNYGGPAYQQAVANGDRPWTGDELLQRRKARELLFEPGSGWSYSNIGYMFVRRLIEQRTRLELGQALRQLVFDPMRIESAQIAVSQEDMGKTVWGNPTGYDPRWVFHGLLVGTPADAVRFLHQLFATDFISPASRTDMLATREIGGPIPGRPWRTTGYGLGLMIGDMAGVGRAIGHSGVGPNSVSALYRFPDQPGAPIVASFARGKNEGVVEQHAAQLCAG